MLIKYDAENVPNTFIHFTRFKYTEGLVHVHTYCENLSKGEKIVTYSNSDYSAKLTTEIPVYKAQADNIIPVFFRLQKGHWFYHKHEMKWVFQYIYNAT